MMTSLPDKTSSRDVDPVSPLRNWEALGSELTRKKEQKVPFIEIGLRIYEQLTAYWAELKDNHTTIKGKVLHFPCCQLLSFPVEVTESGDVYIHYSSPFAKGNFKRIFPAIHLQTMQLIAYAKVQQDANRSFEYIVNEAMREFKMQQQCADCKTILNVHYLSLYRSSDGINSVGMGMELSVEGDLFDTVDHDPELFSRNPMQLQQIILDVLEALEFLHSRSIHHRDVKPENILLFRNHLGVYSAKLADFEFAMMLAEEKEEEQLRGTLGYLSPECVRGHEMINFGKLRGESCLIERGFELAVDVKGDLWALGVTILVSLNKRPTWWDKSSDAELYNISNLNELTIQFNVLGLHEPFYSFTDALLAIDPGKRCTAAQGRGMLEAQKPPSS